MKILLVNDDGIYSNGIIDLAKKLSSQHDIVIIAPEIQSSNSSHTMSFKNPINFKEIFLSENFNSYSLKGTPVDCVKFGLEVILDYKPDLIISGINDSPNVGTDVLYSGTVNAAIEGAMHGIKSIAISQEGDMFQNSIDFIYENLEKIVEAIPSEDIMLNINIPPDFKKEIKVAETGHRQYKDWYEFVENEGYYLKGYTLKSEKNFYKTDSEYYDEGYITISPIKINFNDKKAIKYLKDRIKLWKY